MPIDYSKYPPNWKTEIRPRILRRAKNCCEFCGVENYSSQFRKDPPRFIKVILTIAHLDHDESNFEVRDNKLAALCQRCHIPYDIAEKKRRKRAKKQNVEMDFESEK